MNVPARLPPALKVPDMPDARCAIAEPPSLSTPKEIIDATSIPKNRMPPRSAMHFEARGQRLSIPSIPT